MATTATPNTTAAQQDGSDISNAEKFFMYFQQAVTDIQEQMTALQDFSTYGGERADAVGFCQASIARLSDSVKDHSSIIPAYDLRTYDEAIKALYNKLTDARNALAPRPKFSFKSGTSFTAKKNASAISLNDAAEMANQRRKLVPGYTSDTSAEPSVANTPAHPRSPSPESASSTPQGDGIISSSSNSSSSRPLAAPHIRQPSFSQTKAVRIADHEGLHIILPPSAAHATSSGTLAHLKHCVVDLSSPTVSASGQPFASLTLSHIRDSVIIGGRVSGPVYLHHVHNSVILVSARQFRMHDSARNNVYLLIASRPIIEDCHDIAFTELPQKYTRQEDAQAANLWDQVDDFKWLRNDAPSPHWSVLPASARPQEEVWEDVVPGGPEIGVDDILRAVHVPAS